MAKSGRPRSSAKSRGWPWLTLGLLGLVVAAGWYWREPAIGYAKVTAAYSARVGCSCRFVAGRSIEDCEKDKLAGMEMVTLVEDADAQSVTARFPLLASDTAYYRKGEGCYLSKWEG